MSAIDFVVAVLAGVVQGIVEWLPVSSQGNLALFLTIVGASPDVALQLALFLQIGTTISAATYYREEITTAIRAVPDWRPQTAFDGDNGVTSFMVVACVFTGVVGIPLYVFAVEAVSELDGGVFIALIGVLLLLTGALQLGSNSVSFGGRTQPTFMDACLVGAMQGLAILPGISRSGVTSSALLFRSYEAPQAFRLSFLLSIPASLSAAALVVLDAGGLPGITPGAAMAAFLTSALVGYAAIGVLMRIVERVPFWAVCFGLGGLALLGGWLVTLTT